MHRKCTDQLKAEHQLILQALEVLRQMMQRIGANEDVDRADLLELLDFFRLFAHDYHDMKEQLILLPELAKAGVSLADEALRTIESDHEQVHAAIHNLQTAVDGHNDASFVKLAAKYIELLTTHIFNEDHTLFKTMDEACSNAEERGERIARQFKNFEPSLESIRTHSLSTSCVALIENILILSVCEVLEKRDSR